MKEFECVITSEEGIHATPAGILAKASKGYKSDILLYKGNDRANMKNVFEIMGMRIKKSTHIRIEISGEDEEMAISDIKQLIEEL